MVYFSNTYFFATCKLVLYLNESHWILDMLGFAHQLNSSSCCCCCSEKHRLAAVPQGGEGVVGGDGGSKGGNTGASRGRQSAMSHLLSLFVPELTL